MNMKRRKLKGMTLMEVVVSLAVYAVIGLLIAEIMSLVNATMKATNQLNRRLSYEAKFADNLLYSDGNNSFASNGVTVSLSGTGAHPFNIVTGGTVYQTNATNMEHTETGRMIISNDTNYRFLVFTKTIGSSPAPSDVFYVDLVIGPSNNLASNHISKIIVDASGVLGGGAYINNTEAGSLVQQQVLFDSSTSHTPPAGDGTQVGVIGLESQETGTLLHLAVPAMDAVSGDPLLDPTTPNGPARGQIRVLIFRTVFDQTGHGYNWYESGDVGTISIGFTPGDPRVDANTFPADAVLNLDFVLSTENPNTHERSFFGGVTYTWNPAEVATSPNYLVANEAVGSH